MTAPSPRRRRRRASAAQGEPARPTPLPEATRKQAPQRHTEQRRSSARDAAGRGGSHLGLSAALRARAVNHPTDDDLTAAEHDVRIVRRDWRPPSTG